MLIHEKYIILANEVYGLVKKNVEKPQVLKTDCWNEGTKNFPIGQLFDAVCIDVDKDMVEKATINYPNIVALVGDIRKMSFVDERFDLVIDCSTLDHIQNFRPAIKEYMRVLKNGGYCLVCCWTVYNEANISEAQRNGEWSPGQQYYVYLPDMLEELKLHGEIIKEGLMPEDKKYNPEVDKAGGGMYWIIFKKKI